MQETILILDNVGKVLDNKNSKVAAAQNVSFQIHSGDFTVLVGPSGSGKTTVLLCAGALLKPNCGSVLLEGEDVYSADPKSRAKLRATKLGFVFQQFHLIPYLTVLENVLVPSMAVKNGNYHTRAFSLLDRFGLTSRLSHRPDELSTGERQRTALARALLNKPKLVLADEPTGNLDEENARSVLEYLKEYSLSGGAVLLVSHDNRATEYATSVMHMNGGKLEVEDQYERTH